MAKRYKTKYPGVFYREAQRIGSRGKERVFYIVFKRDGKVIEEKVGRQYADNMTEAKAAIIRGERVEGKRQSRREIREESEAKKKTEAENWTIDRLWEHYTTNRPDMRGIRTDTYRYNLHIKPTLGNKEPHDISPFEVDRIRIKMLKTHKPQTVKHVLVLLNRIVNHGLKKRLCDGLLFKIELPHVDNVKTEYLRPEQIQALLKAMDEDENQEAGNYMKLILFTGMRRSEVLRLKWSDIDYDRGFITIMNPKGGKSQAIPMNTEARTVLGSIPRQDSPYVFPGRDGGQRKDFREPILRIKKRARLPKDFRPLHGLRHVYASMLASSGQVDLYTLQKLLTHKSPEMTQRYAHLRDDALKRAADLAGNLIKNAGDDDNVIELPDQA